MRKLDECDMEELDIIEKDRFPRREVLATGGETGRDIIYSKNKYVVVLRVSGNNVSTVGGVSQGKKGLIIYCLEYCQGPLLSQPVAPVVQRYPRMLLLIDLIPGVQIPPPW